MRTFSGLSRRYPSVPLSLLDQLGWHVKFKKSDLMLSQSKESLVDTPGLPLFKLPPCKSHVLQHNIECLLCLFRKQGQVLVWKLAIVIGQGVALVKAILLAKLLLPNKYCNIAQRANWNSCVLLSMAMILDLEDCCHSLSTWNSLRPCNILLDTNASLTGWGASLGGMMSSPTSTSAGWWPGASNATSMCSKSP